MSSTSDILYFVNQAIFTKVATTDNCHGIICLAVRHSLTHNEKKFDKVISAAVLCPPWRYALDFGGEWNNIGSFTSSLQKVWALAKTTPNTATRSYLVEWDFYVAGDCML